MSRHFIDDNDEKDYQDLLNQGISGTLAFTIVVRRKRRRKARGDSAGLVIILSSNTTTDASPVGAQVGIFAVLGSSDSFTFSFVSNPSGLFSLVGPILEVAAALSVGMAVIAIKADNGAGVVLIQPFIILVSHAAGSYVPTFELLGF